VNIDREIVESVRQAGFVNVHDEDMWLDIMKIVTGRTPVPGYREGLVGR